MKKNKIILVLALLFLPISLMAVCTPQSAVLCAAVDDQADIYINGIYVDQFPYVNWDVAGVYPKCVSLSAGQLTALQAAGNVIAVKTLNTNCCETWVSWSLDITCAAGAGHAFVSSNSDPISMFYDAAATCPATTPTPNAGLQWTDPLYVQNGAWTVPVQDTGYKFGKRLWDPQTGDLLPALGYASNSPGGVSDCKQMFFRQGFGLTIDPTPVPPMFTIAKSASQVSNITGPGLIAFTVHVCNTGGGTFGNTIQVFDSWNNTQWSYSGPYGSVTDNVQGQIDQSGNAQSASWLFEGGIQGGTCYDLIYTLQAYTPDEYCINWSNNAELDYLATPRAYSTVVLDNACPPTSTPMPSSTGVASKTFTPTFTITYTITLVAGTSTMTPTPTVTITLGGTSTVTRTITPTFTATPTFTVTRTFTISLPVSQSPTPTVTRTITLTPVFTPAPGAPCYMLKWGSSGTGTGQFDGPFGMATDSSGNIYVADTYNDRIQKFSSAGTYITQWGGLGSGDGQFDYPFGIATDSSGNVYVTDSGNNRVQEFSGTGTYITQWGGLGSGDGQFDYPFGIATDSGGNVYVSDANNDRIQKFSSTGTYITQWGSYGSGNGQFSLPDGVAVDSSGNVYVVEDMNNRIQKFSSTGAYITQWGSLGSGDGQLDAPYGVAVDGFGNVYVAELNNNRVQKFSSTGTYITQWGSLGSGDGQFDQLFGIAADAAGNIYTSDVSNSRIQKFGACGTPTFTPTVTRTFTNTLTPTSTPGLNFSCWVDADGSGQESVDVSNNTGNSSYCKVAVDASGNPHIVWDDDTTGTRSIYYLKWNGSAWVDADGVGQESKIIATGGNPSLALDSSGRAFISYGYFGINCIKWNGSAWVDADGTGQGNLNIFNSGSNSLSRIKVDALGNPHIVWTHDDGGASSIYYLKWNGSAWVDVDGVGQAQADIYPSIYSSREPSLRIDSLNRPDVSFTNNQEIYFLKSDGSAWVDADGTGQESADVSNIAFIDDDYSALALDSLNRPHIAWYHNGDMYYKEWNGSSWVDYDGSGTESVDLGISGNEIFAQMDLDTAGYPHIFYSSGTNYMYIKYDGISWTGLDGNAGPSVVTNDSGDYAASSFRLDANGVPHVAFLHTVAAANDVYYLKGSNFCVVATFTPTCTVTRTFTTTLTPTFTPTPGGFYPGNIVWSGLPGNDKGSNSCTDASGNIYVVGLEWDGPCACYVIYIYKYLPDGRIDLTFGTGGKMKCPGPDMHYAWNDRLTIKIDLSGRLVIGAYTDSCGGTCADMVIYRCTTWGVIDLTFNGTGYKVCHNITWTGQSYGFGLDFDSTGKIVCTGKAWDGTKYCMITIRCNDDGSTDTTFGTGGTVTYCSAAGESSGTSVACHGGKIYIAGYVDVFEISCSCVCREMYIWCYDESGNLDPSFGTGGCCKYVNVSLNHKHCVPRCIFITIGGKIVVTGEIDDGTGCTVICQSMAIWVFNSDGTPYTTFNSTGMVVDNGGGSGACGEQVLVDTDGKIIVIGTRHNGANTDICIWKYQDDGNLDITFGTGGMMIYDSGNDEEGLSILKITICRLIALGYTYRGPVDQYDQILWNIEDMCPAHTETVTPTATPTVTVTPTLTLTCACVPSFTITATPTVTLPVPQTQTITPTATVTATPSFMATSTFTAVVTNTYTPTNTVTQTPTIINTMTFTPTFTVTVTATVTSTPLCATGTPQFTVHLVYNPEHLDYVVMEITSSNPLSAPPTLVISAHGTCEKKPVFHVTATAEPLDATGTLFRYLYPKQTGWGDIDTVVISGMDICGNAGTSSGDYTKETISKKDVILFKNVINPEKGERCRIVFNAYENDNATVKIYSKNGTLIKTLFNGSVFAGTQHEVIWDGTNDAGQKVVSGIYLVAVDTDYYKATEKIAVVH